MVLIFFFLVLLFSNFSLMNVHYSHNQKKMGFVSRDEGVEVRDCSSSFVDFKTEAQSEEGIHSLTHSVTHSFIHLFIHSVVLKCFWTPSP